MKRKEQLFEDLKDLVLTLKVKRNEIKGNILLLRRWQDKHHVLSEAIKELSSEDRRWLHTQYQEWHRVEIAPAILELKAKGIHMPG